MLSNIYFIFRGANYIRKNDTIKNEDKDSKYNLSNPFHPTWLDNYLKAELTRW